MWAALYSKSFQALGLYLLSILCRGQLMWASIKPCVKKSLLVCFFNQQRSRSQCPLTQKHCRSDQQCLWTLRITGWASVDLCNYSDTYSVTHHTNHLSHEGTTQTSWEVLRPAKSPGHTSLWWSLDSYFVVKGHMVQRWSCVSLK